MSQAFRGMYRSLRRRLAYASRRPRTGRIDWGELRSLKPISRNWGFDRGTPIDRYYIEQFLAACEADIHGTVMEVGTDMYTTRFGGQNVSRSDVIHPSANHPRANLTVDLTKADHLADNLYDCIICTQTLQFIFDISTAVKTLHRVLKPGGVLLITAAGIAQICRQDMQATGEYWRLTDVSLRLLLAELFGEAQCKVESRGNVLSSIAFLHGVAAEELHGKELDSSDPEYQLLITARAVKSHSG